jgi:hypothetical protein
MSEDLLKWKMQSLFKGIHPADAYREIERIKEKHGELTAKVLLSESANPECVFHKYFNWNNADAAEKFRLGQARDLLRNLQVHVISDGQPKQLRVYEVVSVKDGSGVFKNIETFSADDVDYVAQSVVKAITMYRDKLSNYEQFSTVVQHLNDAIEELSSIPVKE